MILGLAVINLPGISGAACEYKSYGRRDPFVPLVGVSGTAAMGGLHNIISVEDVSFHGTVIDADGKKAAVINGEILRQGDRVHSVLLESVGENEITIMINDKKHRLKLYEDR